jgi:hypothetical protein
MYAIMVVGSALNQLRMKNQPLAAPHYAVTDSSLQTMYHDINP